MDKSNARSETGATNQQAGTSVSAKHVPIQPRPPRNSRTETNVAPKQNEESATGGTQQNQQNGSEDDQPRRLSLAELFAGAESEDDENPNLNLSDDSADDPSKPPGSVDSAIKRLGLKKPEDFYAIKVPMPNGAEPLTIGELKDRVGEVVDLETRETAFEQRRIESEGSLLRAQAELREMMALVPKDKITPEMLEKARRKHESTMKRERQLTLEHIPEWHDEKRRTEDMQEIIDYLSDNYGFDENFITTVVDHRAMKFIRDAVKTAAKIKRALSKVTIPEKKGQRASGKAAKGASKADFREKQSNRPAPAMNQRARIAQLFNESE